MALSLKSTVREMRKQAVIETFYDTMSEMKKEDPLTTQGEIIEKAVKAEAPRFFVTFENARRFVSLMVRKKKLPIVNKNKLEMYKEIYRRYMQRIKDGVGQYLILEKIIEEPAPSFYLDEDTFRGIIYKTIRSDRANRKLSHSNI